MITFVVFTIAICYYLILKEEVNKKEKEEIKW